MNVRPAQILKVQCPPVRPSDPNQYVGVTIVENWGISSQDLRADRDGWKGKRTKPQKAATTMMQDNLDSESSGLC